MFVDKVDIYFAHELIASHKKCYLKDQYILDPLHYIKLLERKPGSLDNARAFKGQPWGRDFTLMRSELEYRYGSEGTGRYIAILLLFSEYPPKEIKEATNTFKSEILSFQLVQITGAKPKLPNSITLCICR